MSKTLKRKTRNTHAGSFDSKGMGKGYNDEIQDFEKNWKTGEARGSIRDQKSEHNRNNNSLCMHLPHLDRVILFQTMSMVWRFLNVEDKGHKLFAYLLNIIYARS